MDKARTNIERGAFLYCSISSGYLMSKNTDSISLEMAWFSSHPYGIASSVYSLTRPRSTYVVPSVPPLGDQAASRAWILGDFG